MIETKEVTVLCKAGKVHEAYELAKNALAEMPNYSWVQRAMGWALYYLIKEDSETGNYPQLLVHLEELRALQLLNVEQDSMLFDNVLWKIGGFIKTHLPEDNNATHRKLSELFAKIKGYSFKPSAAYSFLLSRYLKAKQWTERASFLDWWNLDNLSEEDFKSYVTPQGQKMMSLAEQAYIAESKELLRQNDAARIEAFLPRLDALMSNHAEMMYPGYFYGKLLLALGSNAEEALKVVIPFARKKATEFWVWQLLSDVFDHDEEKQLACLLRAVHCRTKEEFLGKVHIKLATLYIKRGAYNAARYHIDAVTRCYTSRGWHIPQEVGYWIHQQWFNTTSPEGKAPIDYKRITEELLCAGAEEGLAIVTYVDERSHRSTIIYGHQQKTSLKLRNKVVAGSVLHIRYTAEADARIKVLSAETAKLPEGLSYAKFVTGVVSRKEGKDFAFLKAGPIHCFISPAITQQHSLKNGELVSSLIVYDYDKKKDAWNWTCVNVEK